MPAHPCFKHTNGGGNTSGQKIWIFLFQFDVFLRAALAERPGTLHIRARHFRCSNRSSRLP